jgi:hypothetical protein
VCLKIEGKQHGKSRGYLPPSVTSTFSRAAPQRRRVARAAPAVAAASAAHPLRGRQPTQQQTPKRRQAPKLMPLPTQNVVGASAVSDASSASVKMTVKGGKGVGSVKVQGYFGQGNYDIVRNRLERARPDPIRSCSPFGLPHPMRCH